MTRIATFLRPGEGLLHRLRGPLCALGLLAAIPACTAAAPPPAAPPPRPHPTAAPPPIVTAAPPSAEVPAPPPEDAADPEESADAGEDGETPDDEEELYQDSTTTPAPGTVAKATSPLLLLSDTEIHTRFKQDPAQLGPLSVGRPNAGALVNGVQMPTSSKWKVLEPGNAWGTQETVDGISKAIEKVNNDFPGSPAIPIGHISSKKGGYLPVHKSHQAGRDVDLGYYFNTPVQQFINGTKANLDLPRTFALVKAFFTVSDVDMMFIDTSIQKLLVEYGVAHGEDASWLDRTFQVRHKAGVFAPVRHVRGHKNHIHVRFQSPNAVALGRRVAGLVAIHAAPPPGTKGAPVPASAPPGGKLVAHKARSGDTLVILAKRYGTTVEAIQRANSLKGIALKAGHTYMIPVPPPPVRGAPLPGHAPAAPQKNAASPAPQKHGGKKGKTGG